jgi:hypothetical protein
MNLYDLMTGAQGGQGVNALANQFGLSAQQTQAALQALAPAFSLALQNATRDPTGFGALLNQMTNGAHAAAYANPGAAAPAGLSANVLGQIFGSQQVAQQIGQQAAQVAGVNPQVVQQMMPLVASMLIGGIAQTMAAQGLGGMIAQLANAFASGAASPAATSPAVGAPFAAWMNMINSLQPGAPQSTPFQAGLGILNSLLEAGVQVSEAQRQGMRDVLDSLAKTSQGR